MAKTHDTLGRKLRDAKQKDDTHVRLTELDVHLFAFLHRHGGRLPTSYIHNFRGLKSLQVTSVRLKNLARAGYLSRPWQQFETKDPEYNELVHELTPKALDILKEKGMFSEYAPTMNGAFKHQVMLSCVSASFELNTLDTDIYYVSQIALLDRIKRDHQIELDGDKFTPDEVFALQIDGKEILCFLEIDRGTEATRSENFARKSWTRSIKQYRQLIGHKHYKERFGVEGGALLIVITISKFKEDGILEVVKEEYESGCNYILVHHLPEFGRLFHPPLVLNLLTHPYRRYNNTPFTFHK